MRDFRFLNDTQRGTIAQSVIRLFLTAKGCVYPKAVHVGFVVEKVAMGQILSEHLCFPLSIVIPPILSTYISPGAGTIGSFGPAVPPLLEYN
jgi:hypothetical protein